MTATERTTKKGTPRHSDPFRDERGRFLHGNPGGPGNPDVREMARVRAAFRAQNPDCIFETVAARLQANALGGHFPSLKLYLEYMMGKPDRSVDMDDLEVWEIYQAIRLHKAKQDAAAAGVALPVRGRPEEEWKRSAQPPRPTPRAVPPPMSPQDRAELEETLGGMKALGLEPLEDRLRAYLKRQDEPAADAQSRAATVSKREVSAARPVSDAPPEPLAAWH